MEYIADTFWKKEEPKPIWPLIFDEKQEYGAYYIYGFSLGGIDSHYVTYSYDYGAVQNFGGYDDLPTKTIEDGAINSIAITNGGRGYNN